MASVTSKITKRAKCFFYPVMGSGILAFILKFILGVVFNTHSALSGYIDDGHFYTKERYGNRYNEVSEILWNFAYWSEVIILAAVILTVIGVAVFSLTEDLVFAPKD